MSTITDQLPAAGALVRHYKGGLYQAVLVARDSEFADRWGVVYKSLADGNVWARGGAAWAALVTWPDGETRPRFVAKDADVVSAGVAITVIAICVLALLLPLLFEAGEALGVRLSARLRGDKASQGSPQEEEKRPAAAARAASSPVSATWYTREVHTKESPRAPQKNPSNNVIPLSRKERPK